MNFVKLFDFTIWGMFFEICFCILGVFSFFNERRGFGAEAPKPQRRIPTLIRESWQHTTGDAAAARRVPLPRFV